MAGRIAESVVAVRHRQSDSGYDAQLRLDLDKLKTNISAECEKHE